MDLEDNKERKAREKKEAKEAKQRAKQEKVKQNKIDSDDDPDSNHKSHKNVLSNIFFIFAFVFGLISSATSIYIIVNGYNNSDVNGEVGDTGSTGKSDYELYKELTNYTGSEEEYVNAFISGSLKNTVSLNLNGGFLNGETGVVSMLVNHKDKLIVNKPVKEGYTFDCWRLVKDNSIYDLNNEIISNTDLIASWR